MCVCVYICTYTHICIDWEFIVWACINTYYNINDRSCMIVIVTLSLYVTCIYKMFLFLLFIYRDVSCNNLDCPLCCHHLIEGECLFIVLCGCLFLFECIYCIAVLCSVFITLNIVSEFYLVIVVIFVLFALVV